MPPRLRSRRQVHYNETTGQQVLDEDDPLTPEEDTDMGMGCVRETLSASRGFTG